ncbi:MAG: hypothetical protein WCK89_14865 [bacterium]
MRVGETEIITPGDDAIGYDLAWRWRMALALADLASAGEKAPAAADVDVRALVKHLMLRRKRKPGASIRSDAFDRVLAWHESDTGALIEAYLIGAVTCEEAAAELGVAADDVRLYSCLFFDLRDDDGSIRPAALLRISAGLQALEIPDAAARLRKVALTGGVYGLRRLLGVAQPRDAAGEPTLDELVEAELKRRLIAGELRTGDLTRLQANAINRERMLRDTGAGGRNGDVVESIQVMQKILSLTAPVMVRPERTQEQMQATDAEIRAKFEVQRNIGATPLLDTPEKGEAALDKLIAGNFTK